MAIVGTTPVSIPGARAEFFEKMEAASKSALWPDVTTTIPSTRDKETFAFLGSVPPVREWGAGRKAKGMYSEKFDVTNGLWEQTLEVDRREIEDDAHAQIRIRISEMAERAAQHKDAVLADLLVNGHGATYLAYDNQPFFSATHSSGESGTQDNTVTITGTSTPNDPTAADLRKGLTQAITRLLSLKDDQGEPMNQAASGLNAIVPPSMLINSSEALNSTILNNSTNVLSGLARVRAFSRLTTASVFYLVKSDVAIRPFVLVDRLPLEFTALEGSSEEGFMRDKFYYGTRARYRLTFGYWQRAIKVTFTA